MQGQARPLEPRATPGVTGSSIGRYTLFAELAAGGMATVHVGRLRGTGGFGRTVAIKRLHAQFAKSPEFVSMFLDEARLASRIRHPNVVSTLDIVARQGELFLVLDFVLGESFAALLRMSRARNAVVPPAIASAIMIQALLGLQAAHEAKNELGEPLRIVHRDVSPQNIIVGADGVARVLDFGVAKASHRLQTTQNGALKGKLGYMAPEQLRRQEVDHRTDVFAASVVLWEALAGRRLFAGGEPGAVVLSVLEAEILPPSAHAPHLPAEADAIVARGLDRDPEKRFQSAREMAKALEKGIPPASAMEIGEWIEQVAGDSLRRRASLVAEIEESSGGLADARDSEEFFIDSPSAAPDESDRDRLDDDATRRDISELHPVVGAPPAVSAGRKVLGIMMLLATVLLGVVLGVVGIKSPFHDVASPSSERKPVGAPPQSTDGALVPTQPQRVSPPTTLLVGNDPPVATAVSAQSFPLPAKTKRAISGATRPSSRPASPVTPSAKPARAGCQPPFTIDAGNVKRYKPDCF